MLHTRAVGALGAAAAALALAVACGGSSETGGSGGAAGKDGGAGSAGQAGSGGNGGGAGASGAGGTAGAAGTGGAAGTSGAGGAGTGGAAGAGGAGACAPPANASDAALCISYTHDLVNVDVTNAALDGQGVLYVEVYDTPTPSDGSDGGTATQPIATAFYPDQPDGGVPNQVSIDNLPTIRIDGLPATVYVRTTFVDNLALLQGQELGWGAWIGGFDFSGGIKQSMPMQTVTLATGQGTAVTQHLTALRRLRVGMTLDTGVTPLDDGQGPATFVVWNTPTPDSSSPIFGIGRRKCADVSGAGAGIDGFVIGPGNYWIGAELNDFNVSTDPKPGDLESIDFSGGTPTLPAANKLTVAGQYSLLHGVKLNFVQPLGDAGAPPPYACAPIQDAGTD